MKLRYLIIAVVALGLAFSSTLQAQPYKSAIGLRLGYPLALSYKQNLDESNAFEIYGGFRSYSYYRWVSVSAAYQKHYGLNLEAELAPLRWYWGAGASAYFYSYKDELFGIGVNRSDYSSVSLGINGYLGLEYTFTQVPLSLSIDWVPTIFVGNGYNGGFGGGYGGLGARYVLGR